NGAVGAQGIQGIQGVKGNTGLAGASGAGAGVLKVFDANHNVIGDYHDAYRRGFMDINGKIYALTVASDGFGENIDHNMQFYSTNDCTGTAYYNFFVSNTTDFGLNDYLWVANKIYEFDHTKAVSITANSMLALNSCDNTGSGFTPRTIQAALFEDLILIQDLSIYPTPFTIGKE
ncbi:MAG: hypothetical protein J0649_05785, partial [Methylococcales bacterium]|nr:hypothetical protein [Methylococcales bacterium]